MPVTSNPNNNYQVEIIEHPDISTLFDVPPVTPSFIQTAANGEEFIEWKITPNVIGYPLIAANMRLGGADGGTYYYNQVPFAEWRAGSMSGNWNGPNPNIQPTSEECTPPVTPHNLTPTITPTPMIIGPPAWRYGTSCPGGSGPWAPFGSIYEAKQVYQFLTPSTNYPNAGIGSPNAEGIWSEYTIIVEVYENDNGDLVNDSLTPATSYLSGTSLNNSPKTYLWIHWDANNHPPITNNIYPKYLKCFSFIQYNSSILNYQAPQILDLLFDLDEVEPVHGCTDPGALNFNSNAVVDDGSCSYSGSQTYQIQIGFQTTPNWINGAPAGPYTDGTMYEMYDIDVDLTYYYTTIDYDSTYSQQNLTFSGNQLTKNVMLQNSYNPGDHVTEVVEVYVYPLTIPPGPGTLGGSSSLVMYDFPEPGGPNGSTGNLGTLLPTDPDYPDYIQRMYYGWGDTKNNLTAASLRMGVGFTSSWLYPDYEDPLGMGPNLGPSNWHNGADPTGFQPTRYVTFSAGGSLPSEVSGISATEEYYPNNLSWPARDWFPTKIKIKIELDFYAPSPLQSFSGPNPFSNSNTLYTIPARLIHATHNQGDLNWVDPPTI